MKGLAIAPAVILAVVLGAAAQNPSRPSPSASAWPGQIVLFHQQMFQRHPHAALATAQAMCTAHPAWPLPFSYRAIAEARLGQWPAARADIAKAQSMDLLPRYHWLWAIALMHGPTPADRAHAVTDARAALAAPAASVATQWGSAEVLSVLLSPAQFLTQLRAAPPLPPARIRNAVSVYAARLSRSPLASMGLTFVWGPSPVPRLELHTTPDRIIPWLTLARRRLGDSAQLEAEWILWLIHQRHLALARGRLRAARLKFPADAHLAWADTQLRLAEAQAQAALGYPRRVLALLSPPPPANPVAMTLQAQALAQLRQYPAAEAQMTRAVLAFETPGAALDRNLPGIARTRGDALAAVLASTPRIQTLTRGQDLFFWQGKIAFAAGDYATAAAAFQASPALRIGLHPLAQALRAISLSRSGHPRQAARIWAKIQAATGQGLSPVYLRLRRGRSVPGTVGIQGQLAYVFCRHGQPVGVEIRDGLLTFPLRVSRLPAHVPARCGPVAPRVWGTAWAVSDGDLLPEFIGNLHRWTPNSGF